MDPIITNIYIFVLAIILAILEIQIEGHDGWAQNLPTWRPKEKHWFTRIYRAFLNDKNPTGYHITMFTFVFLIFHLPYAFGLDFDIINWLKTISLFFMFIIIWNFLWFVLNPYRPIKKFTKEHIWWHKKWWHGLPVDYYLGILLSGIVLIPAIWYYNNMDIIYWWGLNILLFFIEIILVILFTLYVLKIDNWKHRE